MKKRVNHANADIKAMLKCNDLFYWQVAEQMGVAESTLLRWLRVELDAERKARIESAVTKLTQKTV